MLLQLMWKMNGVKNLQLYLVRQTTSPIGMWAVDDSGSSNGGGGDGSIIPPSPSS